MSPEVHARRRRLALRLVGGALTWSLGLVLTALLAPVYDGQTVSDANGLTLTTATYVQRNGVWVLLGLALPLAVSLAVAVAVNRPGPRLRRGAGAAVAILALLGLVLVTVGGVLLLPVAILLGAALALTRLPAHRPGSASAPGGPPGAKPGHASTGSRG